MNVVPEFSRRIDTHRLGGGGKCHQIAAAAAERAGLARRFGLLQLDRLEAEVRLKPMAGGYYRLEAQLEAELVQACIITSEPVPSRIAEAFALVYGPVENEDEIVLDGDSEPVEPLEDGIIDIGEAVAQQLSLALDRFPRAHGAVLDDDTDAMAREAPHESPFAPLARLRKPRQS